MNFLIKHTFILLLGLLLTACKPDQGENLKAVNANKIQENTIKYRVAVDATYPPFEFYDEHGVMVGLDINLLNAIAQKEGFKVEYYHHPWQNMFNELKNGQADIIASAVAITDESKKSADLSDSYFTSPYAIAVLKKENISGWRKLKISSGQNEDAIDDLQNEYHVPFSQIQAVDTVYLSLQKVVKGMADVAFGDATVMRYRVNSPTFKNRNINFMVQNIASADPETDKLVFAVKKGNKELLDKINAGLAELKKSGELDKILKKWE